MARKVVLYIAMSLDGYIADENGSIDWLDTQLENTESDTGYEEFAATVDTVILGRVTYNQIVTELAPDNYPYEDKQSYILTTHPEENTPNKTFTNGFVVDLVTELKQKEGKDIWIVGGSSIAMPLIEANLIDEYQIARIPVILGKGIALFRSFTGRIALKAESVALKNGLIFTRYVKK